MWLVEIDYYGLDGQNFHLTTASRNAGINLNDLSLQLHMFCIEVLHLLCRCRKVAGTMQALLGGDEIYHYHSKLMMKVNMSSCTISIVKL